MVVGSEVSVLPACRRDSRRGSHQALRAKIPPTASHELHLLWCLSSQLPLWRAELRCGDRNAQMSPTTLQWRCRVCNFDRYHPISVLRKDGTKYETAFFSCSQCSVMFLNPAQFNLHSDAAPNVEPTKVFRLRTRG